MEIQSFLGPRVASVKIATLIIGVINLGFIGHSFLSFSSSEEAYLAAVVICFVISFLWTMAIIVGIIGQEADYLQKADMLFHMIACIFYLITLICFFVSLVGKGNDVPYLWERVIAFLLGIANTVLYGYGGYLFYIS